MRRRVRRRRHRLTNTRARTDGQHQPFIGQRQELPTRARIPQQSALELEQHHIQDRQQIIVRALRQTGKQTLTHSAPLVAHPGHDRRSQERQRHNDARAATRFPLHTLDAPRDASGLPLSRAGRSGGQSPPFAFTMRGWRAWRTSMTCSRPLEIEWVDRILLNASVPGLQVPGRIVRFLWGNLGHPTPVPGAVGADRRSFPRRDPAGSSALVRSRCCGSDRQTTRGQMTASSITCARTWSGPSARAASDSVRWSWPTNSNRPGVPGTGRGNRGSRIRLDSAREATIAGAVPAPRGPPGSRLTPHSPARPEVNVDSLGPDTSFASLAPRSMVEWRLTRIRAEDHELNHQGELEGSDRAVRQVRLTASRSARVLAACAEPMRLSNSSAVSLPESICPRSSSTALSRSVSATSSPGE